MLKKEDTIEITIFFKTDIVMLTLKRNQALTNSSNNIDFK